MIIRKSKRRRFTSLSNQLLQDHNLSFAVRGLLAYLLSKPDDWECRITDIEREGNIGTTARRTMMIEAEKAGYLTFERTRNERGQFFSAYTVFEEPVEESKRTFSWKSNESSDLDEPATDDPPPENPRADDIGDIVNTEVQKTDLQKTERERAAPPEKSIASVLAFAYRNIANDYKSQTLLANQAAMLESLNYKTSDLETWVTSRRSLSAINFISGDFKTWLENQSRHVVQKQSLPISKFSCSRCQDTRSISVFTNNQFSHYADCTACQLQEAA